MLPVSFFASVNGDDYNNFLPSVVALPLKIFGCEFSTYVLINHVMFLAPDHAEVLYHTQKRAPVPLLPEQGRRFYHQRRRCR